MSDSLSSQKERFRNWQEGVLHFNAGRFWHAHESWERGWLKLPKIEKLHIQSLIQMAGALYLIEKGRAPAAQSLVRLALEKLERIQKQGGMSEVYPRVVIHGLEQALLELSGCQVSQMVQLVQGISLRAEVLLSHP